jgi:tetratricopeptide (TPR) repeat protein
MDKLIPSGDAILIHLKIDLSNLKFIEPKWKRAHYRAIVSWLTKEIKLDSKVTNLEKIQPLVEAFYHLCELEDWERTSKILTISLESPTNEEFHNQLEIWGYYQEQIDLYNRVLDKVSPEWNAICLDGLGNAYSFLGDYTHAIDFHQKALILSQEVQDSEGEGIALGNLGNAYDALGEYEKQLLIKRKV